MAAIDSDETLLSLLRATSDLYAEQQHAAKNMRKGFLNLAKARQSLGRGTVSALDCREEMWPQFTLEAAPPPDEAQDLEGAEPLWHRHRQGAANTTSATKALRRRGGGGAVEGDDTASEGSLESLAGEDTTAAATTVADPTDGPDGSVPARDRNPLLLFGGLVPPALRKAQADFSAALEHYVAAAGLVHQMALAQSRLKAYQEQQAQLKKNTAETAAGATSSAS
jgi:hypothetical protein